MEQTKTLSQTFMGGLFSGNPVFRLMLGVVPALAVTVTARYGLYMGLAVLLVLLVSNVALSLLAPFVSKKLWLGASLLVISGFVVVLQMLGAAFVPQAAAALGVFLPLAVVNVWLLSRAEKGVGRSVVSALSMGLGFLFALVLVGSVRELLGRGTWFGLDVFGESFQTLEIFNIAPGAFFALAILIAVANKLANFRKGGA